MKVPIWALALCTDYRQKYCTDDRHNFQTTFLESQALKTNISTKNSQSIFFYIYVRVKFKLVGKVYVIKIYNKR